MPAALAFPLVNPSRDTMRIARKDKHPAIRRGWPGAV